jgi:hypothetical protein
MCISSEQVWPLVYSPAAMTHNYTAECSLCGKRATFSADDNAGVKREIQKAMWRGYASGTTTSSGQTLVDWHCDDCEIQKWSYLEQIPLIVQRTVDDLGNLCTSESACSEYDIGWP